VLVIFFSFFKFIFPALHASRNGILDEILPVSSALYIGALLHVSGVVQSLGICVWFCLKKLLILNHQQSY